MTRRWSRVLLVSAFGAVATLVVSAARAEEPDYPHGAFQDDCTLCHAADSWTPARIGPKFEHAKGVFPLTDAHARTPCRSCHASLEFKKNDPACVSCHQDVHQGELGTDCARCHTPRSFIDRGRMSRLHATTGFPLQGSHLATDCEDCHKPAAQGRLRFVNTPIECQSCHLADYQGTTDPDHVAAGFPLTCEQCHTPAAWSSARLDHDRTGFPLTGAHRATACASCHAAGYSGTPTACFACHEADYNGTTDPNHASAGFPTDCQSCHDTTSFGDATFDHGGTAFPLTGAHTTTPCASCHATGYSGTPTACFSCHAAEYNGTTDPSHVAAGFPTDCTTCHNTIGWDGARMPQHDASSFPIYSGKHNGRWTACSDCHTIATNFQSFTCIQCHQHDNQTEVTNDHSGVSGFVYNGQSCYTCHPRGD